MPSLIATLGLNATQLRQGLNAAVGYARTTGKQIAGAMSYRLENAVGRLAKNQFAQFASAAAVGEAIRRTIEYGGRVQDLSNRLGISTTAVQEWDYALKQSGSSIESAAGFFDRLATSRKKALAGDENMVNSFRALGVSIDDLKSKRLEDVGAQIARAFEAGDPQALIADLREIGGRGAGEMVSAFAGGFGQLIDEAREAGVIIEDSIIAKLDEAGDRFSRMGSQIKAGLAPAIAWISEALEGAWRGLQMAGAAVVGFATTGTLGGGLSQANQAWKEFQDQDKAAADLRKRKANGPKGAGLEETESKAEQRAQEQLAEKRERLEERLQDIKDANYLKSLTKEQKLLELQDRKRRAEDIANSTFLSPEERLDAQIKAEELSGQIADEAGKNKGGRGLNVNELQRVGAFVNDPEKTAQLNTQKKSEEHLRDIRDGIKKLASKTETGGGVSYG